MKRRTGGGGSSVPPETILAPCSDRVRALANAVRAILAVGGSINSVKHMQAVASEAKCVVDIYGLFEKQAKRPGQMVGKSPYLQSVHVMGPASLIGGIHPVTIDELAKTITTVSR